MPFSGERIRMRRKQLNMKAIDLGMSIGVQQPQITRIENGSRCPSCELLPALAKSLECSIDFFFTEMDETSKKNVCADSFDENEDLKGWNE